MHRTALVIAIALPSLLAQGPELRDVGRVLPGYRPLAGPQVMADFDGDGLDDLLMVAWTERSVLWLATADGRFVERADDLPGPGGSNPSLAVGDLDGDGDLDVVMACLSSTSVPVRLLLNDGGGMLTSAPSGPLPGTGGAWCVALGDLDGDGDRDIVLGVSSSAPLPWPWPQTSRLQRVFVNQGNGAFVEDSNRVPVMAGARSNTLTFFDQDGDGDLDLHVGIELAVAGDPGELLLRNDGAGVFAAEPMASTVAGRSVRKVVVCDVDGDGLSDLLESSAMGSSSAQLLHYARNDGAGDFALLGIGQLPVAGAIDDLLIADWNGDGVLDYGLRSGAVLYRFVQSQPFVFQQLAANVWTGLRHVHAFDFDGDGDTDLLEPPAQQSVAFGLEPQLLRNLGGDFEQLPTQSPALPLGSTYLVRLVDLDGDGALDLVQAPYANNSGGHGGLIWRGDGAGSFASAPAGDFGLALVHGRGLAFGDVDGDGDLDLVCAARPEPSSTGPHLSALYLQQGGSFVAGTFPAIESECPLLGDVDGDGDLDCVMVTWNAAELVLNDGSGAFSSAGALPITGDSANSSAPAVMADLDGDGDADVVTSNGKLLRNDGVGGFVLSAVGTGFFAGEVLAADFDQDQDIDLVFERCSATGGACLLRNQGNGTFVSAALPLTSDVALTRLHAADVDADGWQDLVVVNLGGEWYGAYGVTHNDGPGGFTLLPDALPDAPDSYMGGAVGDVDGDGDVDLLVAGIPGVAIHRNLHHQVARRGLPRVGRTVDIDLWGRAAEPYILAYSFAKFPTPVPLPGWGPLWLDLGALQLFAYGYHDATGHVAFSTPVPNLPSMVGLELHWQALSGVVARLGNVETTRLLAR